MRIYQIDSFLLFFFFGGGDNIAQVLMSPPQAMWEQYNIETASLCFCHYVIFSNALCTLHQYTAAWPSHFLELCQNEAAISVFF